MDQYLNNLLEQEEQKQLSTVNLVASENYLSKNVRKVLSSSLSNKYAEGLPNNRLYPGVEIIDKIEEYCIQQVRKTFNIPENWYINVQPLSGSPANLEVLTALYPLGSTIMMLSHHQGGHMSHGDEGSLLKRIYNIQEYHLDQNGLLDYDLIEKDITKCNPAVLIAGYCLYPRDINYEKLAEICHKHNCKLHVDTAHIAGFIAAGLMNNPYLFADSVTSTTHKTLRGPRGGIVAVKVQEGQTYEQVEKTVFGGIFPAVQAGPHLATIAALAQACYEAQQPEFKEYMIHTKELANQAAKIFMDNGLQVQTQGTDCHMLLVKAEKEAMNLLGKAGIYVNDCELVNDTPGIRIGFSCMSTFKVSFEAMKEIDQLIIKIIKKQVQPEQYKEFVSQWCKKNFVY